MFRKKSPSDELFLHFFFESSESDRVFIYLHDSNSIFRAWGINSESVSARTVLWTRHLTGVDFSRMKDMELKLDTSIDRVVQDASRMRDCRRTGKKAARDFVPRKIDLQGWVPDWNLRDTAGLVDSEAANLIKQARGFLGVDVASGFDCEAIEHGQCIFRGKQWSACCSERTSQRCNASRKVKLVKLASI